MNARDYNQVVSQATNAKADIIGQIRALLGPQGFRVRDYYPDCSPLRIVIEIAPGTDPNQDASA